MAISQPPAGRLDFKRIDRLGWAAQHLDQGLGFAGPWKSGESNCGGRDGVGGAGGLY